MQTAYIAEIVLTLMFPFFFGLFCLFIVWIRSNMKCPKCGSKDTTTSYDDGTIYCYTCGEETNAKH